MRAPCDPGRVCPIETAVKRGVPPNDVDVVPRWVQARSGSLPGLLCALVIQGKLLVDTKTILTTPHGAHHTRRRYCGVGNC